jgi:muramidase (phage lysozyme)
MGKATQPNRWMDSGHNVWNAAPRWIRDLGLCIRKHESISAGHYNAENPISTASGAYQFLDGTWQGNAKWTKVNGKYVARGYARASDAPSWVQDAVFIHSIKGGGIKAWHGTWCPGT